MINAKKLWSANADLANTCLEHPFVQGIATGDLPLDAFKVYVAQDAFFLEAFARAYALAVAKAPDREGLTVFKDLLNGVFEELTLHEGYAKKWRIELSPTPLPSTRAYTDFLLATAGLEPVGHIAAAMTPCMRLYSWLGQSLAPVTNPDSPYKEWVETYSGPELDDLSSQLETLLDRYQGDSQIIERRYRTAMELELAFFAGAYATA